MEETENLKGNIPFDKIKSPGSEYAKICCFSQSGRDSLCGSTVNSNNNP